MSRRRVASLAGVMTACVWLAALVRFRGWIAEGDNAVFQLRLERMLDGHVPTSGAYSRLEFHHPGPLREWLVGLLYALAGRRASALPATALTLNLVWIASSCWLAHRVARWPGAAAAALGAAALAAGLDWRLHSVWNPHLAVFAGYALLWGTVAAVTSRGRHVAVGLLAASLLAQLHATGAIAGAIATVAMLVAVWRGEHGRRRVAAAIGGVAALWLGPLVDLVDGGGVNVVEIVRGADGARVGPRTAARVISGLTRPWALVDGDFIAPYPGLPSTGSAWLTVVLVAALAALAWRFRTVPRGDADALAASARHALASVALAAVVIAWVSAALLTYPVWPYLFAALTGAFAAPSVLALALLGEQVAPRVTRPAGVALLGACALAAGAGVLPGVVTIEPIVTSPLERALRGAVTERVVPGRIYTVTRAGLLTGTDGELALYVHQAGGEPRSPWYHLDLPAPVPGSDVFVAAMDAELECLGANAPHATRVAYGESVNIGRPVGVFLLTAAEWERLVPVCSLPDP